MYNRGMGVEVDHAKAMELYNKAAKQGYAQAQCNLGCMYDNGLGVEVDYAKAMELFQKAAEQGYVGAQYNLGLMYEKGQGVKQDYLEAHKWFNIAGMNGNEIGRRNADIVGKKMTPGQIIVASGRARKWQKKIV